MCFMHMLFLLMNIFYHPINEDDSRKTASERVESMHFNSSSPHFFTYSQTAILSCKQIVASEKCNIMSAEQ